MQKPWVETVSNGRKFKLDLLRYYSGSYRSLPEMMAKNIMFYRERFEAFTQVVRAETGKEYYDSVLLALIRCFVIRSFATSDYSIRTISNLNKGNKVHEYPYDAVHFDYEIMQLGSFIIERQSHIMSQAIYDDIVTYAGKNSLRKIRAIARLGHDATENLDSASSLDHLSSQLKDPVMFVLKYESMRPAEHLSAVMQQKLMSVLISKGNRLPKLIDFTVNFIDEIAAVKAKGAKEAKVADFLLNRYMSILLYQLPVLDKMNLKLAKDGRSIADAMQDYGCEYVVQPERLIKFLTERKLVELTQEQEEMINEYIGYQVSDRVRPSDVHDGDKEVYAPHGRTISGLVKELEEHLQNPQTERNCAFYAAETLIECLKGKEQMQMAQ